MPTLHSKLHSSRKFEQSTYNFGMLVSDLDSCEQVAEQLDSMRTWSRFLRSITCALTLSSSVSGAKQPTGAKTRAKETKESGRVGTSVVMKG
jgi:hypothetical protein